MKYVNLTEHSRSYFQMDMEEVWFTVMLLPAMVSILGRGSRSEMLKNRCTRGNAVLFDTKQYAYLDFKKM